MIQLAVSVVIGLLVIGFVLWLVKLSPGNETIKQLLSGVVIFIVILVVLDALLGVLGLGGVGTYLPGRHPSR